MGGTKAPHGYEATYMQLVVPKFSAFLYRREIALRSRVRPQDPAYCMVEGNTLIETTLSGKLQLWRAIVWPSQENYAHVVVTCASTARGAVWVW